MACMSSEEIAEAKKEYERITAIPGLVEQIEAEEMARRDKELREYNAREEGRVEGKLETAERMLKAGYSIDEIIIITGLSKEKIMELNDKNE